MIEPNDNFKRLLLALHALTQNERALAALRTLATVNTVLTLFLFGQDYFGWWRSSFPPAVDAVLVGLMTALSSLFCGFHGLVACLYFLWRGRSPLRPNQPRSRTFRIALTPILYGLPVLWGDVWMMGGDSEPIGSLAVAYAVCYYVGIIGLMSAEKFIDLRRGHLEASGGAARPDKGANLPQKAKPRAKALLRWRWWRLTHPYYLRRMRPLDRSLYVSAVRGNARSVAAYLSRGANPNLRLVYGMPLLNLAVTCGHAEVVRLLLEAGADTQTASPGTGFNALLTAAKNGDMAAARLLLEHGASVETRIRSGSTALMLAARQGGVEVVRLLLAHGSQINARCGSGATALMLAASRGHTEAVRALLEASADAALTDAKGVTALGYARRRGHAAIITLLELQN